MKRQHPLLSTLGIVMTAILLSGLAVILWRSGGTAFSPGRLSARGKDGLSIDGFFSHAAFERNCTRCHAPLKTTMDVLCLDCHDNIAQQIAARTGSHGVVEQVNLCMECHEDHNGQDFDMLSSALDKYDHSVTDYSLVWHQLDYQAHLIDCRDCHQVNERFDVSMEKCADCHAGNVSGFMNTHQQDFGHNCLGCHDGLDRMTRFDHAATSFPLEDYHSELSCAACHSSESMNSYQSLSGGTSGEEPSVEMFRKTPKDCFRCHAEPEVHRNSFSADCTGCHSTAGWTPASWDGEAFGHNENTQFTLALHATDFDGRSIPCAGCHQGNIREFEPQVCIDCHSRGDHGAGFMDEHTAQFGSGCLDCHDGVDRMSDFDHSRFFQLDGAHSGLECLSCHPGNEFMGLSRECVDCHAEPEIHSGFFGLQCQNCHSTTTWAPATLRYHAFPLDHGDQGQVSCETCHEAAYSVYTCYGCHEHEPIEIRSEHLEEGITSSELEDCAVCHPTGLEEND